MHEGCGGAAVQLWAARPPPCFASLGGCILRIAWVATNPTPHPPSAAHPSIALPRSCATPAVLELLGGEGSGGDSADGDGAGAGAGAAGGAERAAASMVQYLGVLEQRANELLAQYCLLAADGAPEAAGERAAALLRSPGGPSGAAPLRFVIEPPSVAGGAGGAGAGASPTLVLPSSAGSREDEDGLLVPEGPGAGLDCERPLSRGSLAARAARAVAARGADAVKIKAVRPHHTSSTGGGQAGRRA